MVGCISACAVKISAYDDSRMKQVPKEVRAYLAAIGREGGEESPQPVFRGGARQNGGRQGFLLAAKLCR
jgi:hypothetical protein